MDNLPYRIMLALRRLEWDRGIVQPVSLIRRQPEVQGVPKARFDAAAMDLLNRRLIYMAPHDHAMRLPPEEREQLVRSPDGVYYVSMSSRSQAEAALPADQLVLLELERLEQESSPPNHVADLRHRPNLAHLKKREFDEVLYMLHRRGFVQLIPHRRASEMPVQELRQMLEGLDGKYYSMVALRRRKAK